MRETLILLTLLYIGLAATSDLSGYMPRGWRPNGQSFNPDNNRLHAYYGTEPGLRSYEPPPSPSPSPPNAAATTTRRAYPSFATTTDATTTGVKITTTTTTTTTPRSREPTTAPSERPDDNDSDFDANPALAIANSFAFNRPVYVYNTFPFLPAPIFAQ